MGPTTGGEDMTGYDGDQPNDEEQAHEEQAHEEQAHEEQPAGEEEGERIDVRGDDLISKVRELVHEGNVRRIIIENEKGETLVEIPLTIGVVGAVLIPVWAAIGAIAAVATRCTIRVERRGESEDE
jgi:hypothetical protein